MKKPISVLISDNHYSLPTLTLADAAYRMAIDKALDLGVPLIDCGDITNDKALLRAEVVNAMISTMTYANRMGVELVFLVGNHSLINEKGKEHALHFLEPHGTVISEPTRYLDFSFIPYQSTPEAFASALRDVPKYSTLIMHQGVSGSDKGEYVHDHSAIDKSLLSDFRTLSGHYHRAQTIDCGGPGGRLGVMDYVGTSYTVTYAEANDGPKGFQILYDDGSLEKVPTNLRKHIVEERMTGPFLERPLEGYNPGDLLWLKVLGNRLDLEKINKNLLAKALGVNEGFKLDLIPLDAPPQASAPAEKKTNEELLDGLIGQSAESEENKGLLRALWRKVLS